MIQCFHECADFGSKIVMEAQLNLILCDVVCDKHQMKGFSSLTSAVEMIKFGYHISTEFRV